MANAFDFLGKEEEGSLPEGSGVFGDTGFIGQLMAKKFWQFWSAEDLSVYEPPYLVNKDYFVRGNQGSYFYYFIDEKSGKDATELLEAFAPRQVWRFQMLTNSIVSQVSTKFLDAFGDDISVDCRLAVLGSAKYRHEYHLVTLPSLIDALARQAGFIKEPIWHAGEILDGMAAEEFTEEVQNRLIGDPSATNADRDKMAEILTACNNDLSLAQSIAMGNAKVEVKEVAYLSGETKIHWLYSQFGYRRTKLWAALGENNPEAYIPEGTAQTEWGKEHETKAKNLITCLGVSTRSWQSPIWARFHMLKDPRVDAVYTNSGGVKRLSLPLVSETYSDDRAALEAAEKLGVTRTAETAGANPDVSGQPAVPESWGEENRTEWIEFLQEEKEKLGGNLPTTTPAKITLSKKLAVDVSDIEAWWNFV